MSGQIEIESVITDIIKRTYDVKSFRVDDMGGIPFEAGQFMLVSLGDSKDLERYISISNSPTETGYLELTKKITDSIFSKKLEAAKKGTKIKIRYPFGNFTLKKGVDRIVFLSGGIGVTPIRSISKYICDKRPDLDAVMLFGNRSRTDIVFREDFDSIEKSCAQFRVVYILSQPEEDWAGLRGHISSGLIKEEIPDYRERHYYICGPPLMVSGIKCVLKDELGLPDKQIIFENFAGY